MIREDGVPSRVGLTPASELEIEVDLDEGAHEWWVTAMITGCSPTISEPAEFNVDLGIPDECDSTSELLLLSPREGTATIVSPVILEWTAVPGATGYQIWVLEGANDTPRRVGPVRETTQAVVRTNVGTIRWYVEAFREECPSVQSPIEHFLVVPPSPECEIPGRPTLFAPQRVASGTMYRISWAQVPGSTIYEVQESTSPVFRGLPVRVVRGTSTSYEHVVDSASAEYYYRVRALADCDGERGPYSKVARVSVDGSASTPGASSGGLGLRSEDLIGSQKIELNKDAYSQTGLEEFRVVLRSPNGETETVRIIPDQEWLTVEPEVVTLTAGGVEVTVFADLSDLPLGASEATLRFEPTGGGKSASQTSSTTVTTTLVTPTSESGKNEPLPESLIVPAVAHTDGVNSTWLSDIRLSNLGAVSQKYQLNYTPAGVDGTETGQTTQIDVGAGSTVALNDVLANWYGSSGAGATATGMLEIRPQKSSTSSSIGGLASVASGGFTSLASSRTYNFTPNGTFGQFIPAIRFESFVGAGSDGEAAPRLSMQQISQSSAYRTNLGLVEASGQAVDALVEVYDTGGTLVGSFNVGLLAGEHKQLNSVLDDEGITVENGRIEVSAASGSGRLMAYASVVDNLTGDPQLVRAATIGTDTGKKWVLPGVADLNTGQASWRTDMRILNADPEPRNVTLTYYAQNDPGVTRQETIELGAGEIAVLDDLVASVFGETNSGGVVHVETEESSNIVTTGRTYNQEADGGTYGQFIPAVNAARAVGSGDRALQILQVEQSERFRANLGLAEVTGQGVQLEVSAVIPGSKARPSALITLDGNE
ncbi:MAG: hypothetical protein R3324_04180, partial [Halobacteriales archaeon]|nr:hypothetical protein [Halobacteriales archaeon]